MHCRCVVPCMFLDANNTVLSLLGLDPQHVCTRRYHPLQALSFSAQSECRTRFYGIHSTVQCSRSPVIRGRCHEIDHPPMPDHPPFANCEK